MPSAKPDTAPFWDRKTLDEMSREEWESLCDGCGKCCLLKLEDVETGALATTNVVCRLFNRRTGACRDYANRTTAVPGCIALTPQTISELDWLPETCAYRRLDRGEGLPDWHPLVTGRRASTRESGHFVGPTSVSERRVREADLVDHVTAWLEPAP
ncbi:MAG: YcgN family cysteine cluster protein [Pseudomonadota bacterium]